MWNLGSKITEPEIPARKDLVRKGERQGSQGSSRSFVSIWGFDVGSVMHVPMTFLKELLNLLLVLHVFVVAVYMHSLSLAPWLSNFVFHQFQHLLCLHSPIARNAASESASRRLLRLLFVVAERGYLDLG